MRRNEDEGKELKEATEKLIKGTITDAGKLRIVDKRD